MDIVFGRYPPNHEGRVPMKVVLTDHAYEFRPWKPSSGYVFDDDFAFECGATLIYEDRPSVPPAYVSGAAFGGTDGYFIQRAHVAEFFTVHGQVPVIFRDAAVNLAVIHTLAPDIDIYRMVDQNNVWDTQLLDRLNDL